MNDIVSESGGNKYASIPDTQIPKVIDDVKKRKAIVNQYKKTKKRMKLDLPKEVR